MFIEDTVKFLEGKIQDFKPEIGIVLGSGLGELADEYCNIAVSYSEIPHFISSTVKGHKGRLVFAVIEDKNVVMMQGRNHFYEGHSMQEITYPIKVMKNLGVKTLILTNAAGAVNETYEPSDLMLIKDHINCMGTNPLIGANDDNMGERFPDMSDIYKKELRDIAKKSAQNLSIDLKEGVYLANTGPSYETPAEIRMARLVGADAVGMSTVPEAIVANYCGLRVLGISCISNTASSENGDALSHAEVIDITNRSKTKFKAFIKEIIKNC